MAKFSRGSGFIIKNSYGTSQRYGVAKKIFACLYHALRCLDEKQETAVSSSGFVQISLCCAPPHKDSSSCCGVIIISRNQAIKLPLSLVVFFMGFFPPLFFNYDNNTTLTHTGFVVLGSLMLFEAL